MFYIRLGERQKNTIERTPSKPPLRMIKKKKERERDVIFKRLSETLKSGVFFFFFFLKNV